MADVRALGTRLQRQGEQEAVLHRILRLSAGGADVSQAAPAVVRHILSTSAANNPALLAPAYDLLTSIPSNPSWVETLASFAKSLSAPSAPAFAVALSAVPALPHPALAHLALVATPSITGVLTARPPAASPRTRVKAVAACAAIALRDRPATAPAVDALRVDALSPDQVKVVRGAVEHALSAIVAALEDPSTAVALAALGVLASFAAAADAVPQSSVLRATKEATAAMVWDLVLPRAPRVASRLMGVINVRGGSTDGSSVAPVERRPASVQLHERRAAVRGLARVAARALSGASLRSSVTVARDESESDAHAAAEASVSWAVSWVDRVLAPCCDDEDWHVSSTAASALLMVCSYCKAPSVGDKRARWGARGTARLARVLGEHSGKMSALLATTLTKDAFRALAALSKESQVTTKFVVGTAVALLPHAAACPRVSDRLEALVVIASTVVEYDLRGADANPGSALKAVTGSSAWTGIISESVAASKGKSGEDPVDPVDSATAAELVCCFGQSMLDASRKIVAVKDMRLREGLMGTWADMLAKLLQRTSVCLSWPHSSASSFAKEMFLKMFEALGQYSSYLMRSRGMGLDEYERLQEHLVAAALKQEDANIRAALLLCVTKYWIASALKAEANAGHVMKGIWRHAQEHYHDDELVLKEMRTGVMWGDAEAVGRSGQGQQGTPGGYVSVMTALTKRTRAVIDTVGSTFTEVLETTLFGSIALVTSALEGTTLTTDFAYSSLAALLALVHRNPTHAEKAIEIARKYISIMERAESADLLVLEAVQNTIAGLQMYLDEFFPKPVPVRADMAKAALSAGSQSSSSSLDPSDPHSWLAGVTESCVYATSRLDDQAKESITVSAEEAVLHASTASRVRLKALHPGSLHNREHGATEAMHGDQQTLSGASDPFGVTAWHAMDTVKALATLHVEIVNRSLFHVSNVSLCYSAGGALTPLPDVSTEYLLGSLAPGTSTSQRLTLAVRHNQGYAGRIQLSVHVREDVESDGHSFAEQACLPYYIPSSDVLLLRAPPPSAGVDVFRRRWDLMREACSFHVIIRKDQDLDGLVDTLERRSRCLREVGRMRVSSHVSAMVADSSRGDYIALAALAPEARGDSGVGPCLVYATIRSNSAEYSRAFRSECRDWLSSRFKVIVQEEEPDRARKVQALRPQDAYFANEGRGMSDYQRWRAAHAARMACS